METKSERAISRILVKLEARGMAMPRVDAATLRRAEMMLHRWAEGECGDGNAFGSWCITRDETTGKPYREYHPNNGSTVTRTLIPDREAGALKRVAAICARYGLQYFHQTDPRGCALYVGREKLTDTNYSSLGVAICD